MRFFILLLTLLAGWMSLDAEQPLVFSRMVSLPPKLARSFPVQAFPIAVGRGILDISSGQLTEFKSGEQLLGYHFTGRASFTYLSEEPLEAASFAFNIKNNTPLRTEAVSGGGLMVKDAVKEALLWVAGQPLPALPEASGSGDEEAFIRLLNLFHPISKTSTLSPAWASVPQTMALVVANDPEAVSLIAEMSGGKQDLIFSHLAASPGQEGLSVKTVSGLVQLSEQTVGWSARQVPTYPFILSHLDIDLTALGERSAKLKVMETITPTRDGLTLIGLDLINALDLERPVRLKSVRLEDGTPLRFHHGGGRLLVELAKPTQAFHPMNLAFDIEGDLIWEERNASRWQLGLWPWFPQPEMGAQCYTVHAIARVRRPHVPIMPGTWLKRGEEGGLAVLETRIDRPIQFFVVDAGRFDMQEIQQGSRIVRVWTYHTETRNTDRLARLSHKIIDYYESVLGPFPFQALNMVQVQDYGFGQAPPGTMYITREAFNVLSDDIARMVARGINDRIAHEIAHQWWGHVVKMATPEDQWVTEAFAEFSSALAMLNSKGKGRTYFMEKVKGWEQEAKEAGQAGSIAGANRVRLASARNREYGLRNQLLYDKGAYFLYDLQQKIGEESFLKFLVNIPANIQWRYVSEQNLLDLLKAITGKDFTNHFDRYLWGSEMPDGRAIP